jgi:hypothetical protein
MAVLAGKRAPSFIAPAGWPKGDKALKTTREGIAEYPGKKQNKK